MKPLEDSKKTTDIILEALKNTGQRGIIDRGWGDLGACMFVLLSSVLYNLLYCVHSFFFFDNPLLCSLKQ